MHAGYDVRVAVVKGAMKKKKKNYLSPADWS
jgi:hypothetical protein